MYLYAHIHIYIYIHIYVHTLMYSHTHIYMYIRWYYRKSAGNSRLCNHDARARRDRQHTYKLSFSRARTWTLMYLNIEWLQLVGFLKLQVSFAEYSLFYMSLLQKRRMTLRSQLSVSTPYCHRTDAWLCGKIREGSP